MTETLCIYEKCKPLSVLRFRGKVIHINHTPQPNFFHPYSAFPDSQLSPPKPLYPTLSPHAEEASQVGPKTTPPSSPRATHPSHQPPPPSPIPTNPHTKWHHPPPSPSSYPYSVSSSLSLRLSTPITFTSSYLTKSATSLPVSTHSSRR